MNEAFNKWWNSDGLIEDNPYKRDTPAFWAWEGWQAGRKDEALQRLNKAAENNGEEL